MNAPLRPEDIAHAHAVVMPSLFRRPDRFMAPVAEGLTLAAFVDQSVALGRLTRAEAASPQLIVTVHGCEIPRANWRLVRPKRGAIVLVRIRPMKSGGGGGKKNPLRTILTLLVVVAVSAISAGTLAAPLFGATLFEAGSTSALLLAGVASIALNALVNAIAPVPQLKQAARSASYTIGGARNGANPYGPMTFVLGMHRVTPPLAMRYLTRVENDVTFLLMLVQWHVGQCHLTDLKIGETPIENFNGVTIQHRLGGEPYAGAITLIPKVVIEDPDVSGIELKQANYDYRRSAARATKISIDIAFPGGLFKSKDGDPGGAQVDFQLEYRPVGSIAPNLKVPVSASPHMTSNGNASIVASKMEIVRRTFEWTVPEGQYDVVVHRSSPDTTASDLNDTAYWVALRSHLDLAPVLDDAVCVTALEIKSSEQLNGTVDSLNGIVEAIVPRKQPDGTWASPDGSSNPADLFRWLHTGPLIVPQMALPISRMHDEDLAYWSDYCAAKGASCNAVVDYAASVDEIAALIASCGYAGTTWTEGKRSIVIDDARLPTQLFTSQTVRGFRGKITYPEDVHALRCSFANADAGYKPDGITVYADGYDINTATAIQPAEFPGKVHAFEVWRAARRLIKRAQIRRIGYEFDIDVESLVCRYGDRAFLEHYALHRPSASATVVTVIGAPGSVTGVQLSEDITLSPGTLYGVRYRRVSDGALIDVDVTNPATVADVVTPTLMFAGGLAGAVEPHEGDLIVFGELAKAMIDVSIVNLTPSQGELTASVSAVPYDASLFVDDGAVAPPHLSRINAGAGGSVALTPTLNPDTQALALAQARLADATLPNLPLNALIGSASGRSEWPITADNTSISVGAYTINEYGTTQTLGPGTVTGLAASTKHWVYWDYQDDALAVTPDATEAAEWTANVDPVNGRRGRYRLIGIQYTTNIGGTYPTPDPGPPGGGGGGGGGFDFAN